MKLNKAEAVETKQDGLNIIYVPVEGLLRNKEIPYRTVDKEFVEALSQDIEHNGLDNPIQVWDTGKVVRVKMPDGEKLDAAYIIAGVHRTEAIKSLKGRNAKRYSELFPNGVPAIVSTGELPDALFRLLRENVQRKEMSAEQILPIMRKLRDEFKMKNRQIAKEVGKSDSWVSQIFDLEETLGKDGVDKVTEGKLSIREAQKVAKSVKEKRAKGEDADVSAEIDETAKERGGLKRAKKRVSAKKLQLRYAALPSSLTIGARVKILEDVLRYLAEEIKTLPKELREEPAAE